MRQKILIVYDSKGGNTAAMALQVARGVELAGLEAVVRAAAPVAATSAARTAQVPDTGAPYATLDDLRAADGLIIGTPTHFGNMSAALKHFIDQSTAVWFGGTLAGKPAGVFCSTGSLHGGQESTLLSMMVPLLHHGMLICGLPYTQPELMQTVSGGSPYGATHVAGESGNRALDDVEATLCQALGQRIARTARALAATRAGT